MEKVAQDQDEEFSDWLTWNALETVLATLERALEEGPKNFFSNLLSLRWSKSEYELLETAVDAYALNQPESARKPC